jgi:hypothetical protein
MGGTAYRCDTGLGLTVSVADGDMTLEQRREQITTLAADPDWPKTQRLITDLTTLSAESRPSAERVAESSDDFLRQLAPHTENLRWAIVAHHTFHEAQMFERNLESQGPRIIVFNNVDTACTWLGVDTTDVRDAIDDLRRQLRAD